MVISRKQLSDLEHVLEETKVPFMVGFNRRFSPLISRLREFLRERIGPLMVFYRVNTESLGPFHWVHSSEGGGRVIGEGCHFIDLLNYLISSDIESVTPVAIHSGIDQLPAEANFQVTLKYRCGSLAILFYTSFGTNEFPKEYMEVFFEGQVITLNDFRELKAYGSKLRSIRTKHEQKGHLEELEQLAHFLKGKGNRPISLREMINTTLITFEIDEKLKSRKNVGNEA